MKRARERTTPPSGPIDGEARESRGRRRARRRPTSPRGDRRPRPAAASRVCVRASPRRAMARCFARHRSCPRRGLKFSSTLFAGHVRHHLPATKRAQGGALDAIHRLGAIRSSARCAPADCQGDTTPAPLPLHDPARAASEESCPRFPPSSPPAAPSASPRSRGLAGAAACTQFLTLNMPFGACARAIPSSARPPLERRAPRSAAARRRSPRGSPRRRRGANALALHLPSASLDGRARAPGPRDPAGPRRVRTNPNERRERRLSRLA